MSSTDFTATSGIEQFLQVLATGERSFVCNTFQPNLNRAIFGGQTLGLAQAAADRTVAEGFWPHMLQMNFVAAGRIDTPIEMDVEFIQESRRFASRLVRLSQAGRLIATASVSYHRGEKGFDHATSSPTAPPPEDLRCLRTLGADFHDELNELSRRVVSYHGAGAEIRPIDPESLLLRTTDAPHLRYWIRHQCATPPAPRDQYALLAYLSDSWFGMTVLLPHRPQKFNDDMFLSSLNHTVWFHTHDLRTDDWLLVDAESPAACHGRGLTLGRVYDRNGRIVATLAQECLYRLLEQD